MKMLRLKTWGQDKDLLNGHLTRAGRHGNQFIIALIVDRYKRHG